MKQVIEQLYDLIDKEAWEAMLELFSEDIYYERIEPAKTHSLIGKDALQDFYANVRTLKGHHTSRDIQVGDRIVTVVGTFAGTQDNKPVALDYTDEFVFNDAEKITQRKSVITFQD